MAAKNTKSKFAGKYCMIAAKESGLVLEAVQNTHTQLIVLSEADGNDNQLWQIVKNADSYKFICKASHKVLDIIASGIQNGAWIHQWENTAVESQLWDIVETSEGCCKIKSALSGKCLDVVGMCQTVGANIQIWEDVNGDNQQWRLILPAEKTVKKVASSKTVEKKKPAATKTAANKKASAASKASAKKVLEKTKSTAVKTAEKKVGTNNITETAASAKAEKTVATKTTKK